MSDPAVSGPNPPLRFSVSNPEGHLHVPLLVTPWELCDVSGKLRPRLEFLSHRCILYTCCADEAIAAASLASAAAVLLMAIEECVQYDGNERAEQDAGLPSSGCRSCGRLLEERRRGQRDHAEADPEDCDHEQIVADCS